MSEIYYLFTPPSVAEYRSRHPLFGRIATHQGISVLRFGDAYTQVRTPTSEQIDTALEVYLGGYSYLITKAQADDLIAAGYEDCIVTGLRVANRAYGTGAYGSGSYGSTPRAYGRGTYGKGAYGS